MATAVTKLAEIAISNKAPLRLVVNFTRDSTLEAHIFNPISRLIQTCRLANFSPKCDFETANKLKVVLNKSWARISRDTMEVSLFPRLLGGGCGSSSDKKVAEPQLMTAGQNLPKLLPNLPPLLPNLVRVEPGHAISLEALQNYRLGKDDYFNEYQKGCTTILNNHVAAMKRCLELTQGVAVFEDPDFGPRREGGATSIYYSGNAPNPSYTPVSNIKWQRPSEVIPKTCFFTQEISTNDAVQGNLGDCWFIGALSVLATRDELIRGSIENLDDPKKITGETAMGLKEGIYPPMFHPFAKKGLYCFTFFKNAMWRYVIIDDKLPFQKDAQTPTFVFAHCREHRELWVALIEKAYAKLHDCYEALVSGLVDDGLVDMTGYTCETLKLTGNGSELVGPEDQLERLADNFWKKISGMVKTGSLLGCSIDTGGTEESVVIDQHPSGLLSGHAYSVSTLLYINDPLTPQPKKRHRLLALRNPWGEAQYTGKWGQSSQELSSKLDLVKAEIQKLEVEEQFDPQDTTTGAFLMCFRDWRSVFTSLFVCLDFPPAWSGVRFVSEWTAETSGGLPLAGTAESLKSWGKNPQYVMELTVPTDVFISLFQEDGRLVPDLPYPFSPFIKSICISLLKLKGNEQGLDEFNKEALIKNSTIKNYRDTNINISLSPGRYLIVPSTKDPGQTTDFYLSVYFSCPKPAIRLYQRGTEIKGEPILEEEETSSKATPGQVEKLRQLFGTLLRS